MPFPFIFTPVLVIFLASQAYWLLRGRALARRWIVRRRPRLLLSAAVLAVYFLLLGFNFGWFGRDSRVPTQPTLTDALLVAPFLWWAFSSMVAFLVAALFHLIAGVLRAGAWAVRKISAAPRPDAPASPARRDFLGRTATVASALPFVAGAYGLLYGRLNLETSRRRIRLARLPAAFEGFRIVQLSDIHIGPFMSEREIRKYVRIANELRPHLVALTGDFITWDPGTQQAVVDALAGLRAPFGVFGCLGNHETWSGTEDSITGLFSAAGVRMLRQQRVPVATGGETFHLLGVDFISRRWARGRGGLRENIGGLIVPDAVNILLSHNPDTFDEAAALGIDLSLAGHTHGGQVALEFISPYLAPSRLMTPYVSGWFEKPGGQLYVNRGIGTVGAPIRVGAPPEITIFELTRGV